VPCLSQGLAVHNGLDLTAGLDYAMHDAFYGIVQMLRLAAAERALDNGLGTDVSATVTQVALGLQALFHDQNAHAPFTDDVERVCQAGHRS